MSSAKQAAGRAAELRKSLEQASHDYYVLDRPKLSDREYDALFRELSELEAAHPPLRTADSPSPRKASRFSTAPPR